MDGNMHNVETTLSHVGRRCNKGAVDKGAASFTTLKRWQRNQRKYLLFSKSEKISNMRVVIDYLFFAVN